MTTPPNDDAPTAAEPPETSAEPGTPPPADAAAAQQTGQLPPSPPPPFVPPPGAPPPPPPWLAPVPRAPRVLWINPARRVHVIGTAAVAGLVLLGAGIGIGWGTSGGGHDHRGGYHIQLGPGYFPQGPQGGHFPRHLPGRLPPMGTAPVPAPSATK